MGAIIPFPAARRIDHVERVARAMARSSHRDGEALILREAEALWERLSDLGVQEPLIEHDVLAFAGAIRARLFREIVLQPGDTA